MTTESLCPLCGSPAVPLFTKNKYELLRCKKCRFAFVGKIPDRAHLENHYNWDYFHGDPLRFGYLNYESERGNRLRGFESKHRHIENLFPQGGRLLDVGCADGSFLGLFGPQWEKHGVELSKDMVQQVPEAFRSTVFQGFFEDFPEKPEYYDAITLWDVLDHVSDPIACLQKAHRLLKKGGVLGLVSGDMDSAFARLCGKNWYLYVPPVHISYFSRTSIRSILERTAMPVQSIEYEGKSVSLRLVFFRLRYIIPWGLASRLMEWLWRITPESINFGINFYDVMTVWAKKSK